MQSEKFIPKDENDKVITLTTNYKYFCKEIKTNITSEDRSNQVYFKNDKFNMMTFINSKWKNF